MWMSFRTLFLPTTFRGKILSFENLLVLAFLYGTIMMGFGLLYLVIELEVGVILLENGSPISGSLVERLATNFYFSSVTLFSVGYGDIVPIGIGRALALIEAFIGYTIPAAFVVRSVIDRESS
ncbi:ion channel [Aeribacillus pallidus]|uniref:ion channel n=1 Tax=Aeribacillus pallidus TaxID=33936 RepID=UPI003D244A5E